MTLYMEQQLSLVYTLALGVITLITGLVLLVKRVWFFRYAHRTHGEVISIEERHPFGPLHSRGQPAIPCPLPKIRFTADNGIPYEFVTYASIRFLSYRVGNSLPVIYDPQNPREVFINHFLPLWSGPVSISALGIIFLLFVFIVSHSLT